MLDEVVEYLQLKNGDWIIDCTLGGAGYTIRIAKKVLPDGRVFSFDMDGLAILNAKKIIKQEGLNNIEIINDNFKSLRENIEKCVVEKGDKGFSGIVFDLGLSSAQLEDRARGFSFQLDAPLDMAFGDGARSTYEIVNHWHQSEIIRILREFGEERYSPAIAKAIVNLRKEKKIKTTKHLVEIIRMAVPRIYRNNKKIHFATKTFQALRIATNGELDNIKDALPQALSLLKSGGRIVVVSYHSLEDRIVKQFFKKESRDCLCPKEIPICQCVHKAQLKIITKKILTPGDKEVERNPRARSAKMRVAEKI